VLDMGVDHGFVRKSGAWYAVDSERIGQGRDNAIQYLREHPELLAEIELQVRQVLGVADIEDGNKQG